MNTYYLYFTKNCFFTIHADRFDIEDGLIHFIFNHHVTLSLYESNAFSIEQLHDDYSIGLLWTGAKYERYQKDKGKV